MRFKHFTLPTRRLSDRYRHPVRFIINGLFFTLLQTLIYWGLLKWTEYVTTAFSVAFIIEMILNYIFTNYYIFNTTPRVKNAGGYAISRFINYFVQVGFLHILIKWLGMSEEGAGPTSILLAGIINYFFLAFFFKTKKKNIKKVQQNSPEK